MSVWKKTLAATAGLAAVLGVSSPAAAQYYPGYSQGYGYGGYAPNYNYGMDPRAAVDICSRAVQGRYGVRVTGIRSSEPRNNGAVRVDGYVTDYRGYGYGNPNLTFSCKVDRYARVIDLRVDRNDYRGW